MTNNQGVAPLPPNVAQPHVQARLYDAGCELEHLASLMDAITDQLDGARDPHGIGATSANLARIAFDAIGATGRKLLDAESACGTCWKGRLAIAAALTVVPGPAPHMGD